MIVKGSFQCLGCGHDFEATYDAQKPKTCPSCGSANIYLVKDSSGGQSSGGGCRSCGCGHGH